MTIDKILKKYKDLKTEPFKKRMKAFEGLHASENIEKQQLLLYTEYIVIGNPEDRENYPGALEKAHNFLGTKVKDDKAKVDDLGVIAQTLETYVDVCLSGIMGKEAFDKFVKSVKAEGLDEKAIRAAKGSLLSQHVAYGDKSIPNVLDENYIKKLKGKKKIDIIARLKGLAKSTMELYSSKITDEVDDLFTLDDHTDLAEYVSSKFKEAGLSHDDHHLTKTVDTNRHHYRLFLTGETKELVEKHGYEYTPVKEKRKPMLERATTMKKAANQ